MTSLTPDYLALLDAIKVRVQAGQTRAVLAVSRELLAAYWDIGRLIHERQQAAGWGDEVIGRLARDLQTALPGTGGYSRRNLYRMRALYLTYPSEAEFVSQPVAQLPWGHVIMLLERVKDAGQRRWYGEQALKHGWSRAILDHQIATGLHTRQVEATKTHNFARTLPSPDSDLITQALKDPYIFDFLGLAEEHQERQLEQGLLSRLKDFLLELGKGFALLGSQYHLEVGGQDFYIDLLFYHYELRRLVAIELKSVDFQPEFAGKLNFYLAALDAQVKHPQDGPSIGILLCRHKNAVVADYALSGMTAPIGVSTYSLDALPNEIRCALPTPEELQEALGGEGQDDE